MQQPVIKGARFFLAHAPGFVRYGSKPWREIAHDPGLLQSIRASLRSFEDAVIYAPHQVLLGNLKPDDLTGLEAPWFSHPLGEASVHGPHGDLVDEEQLLGLLRSADQFNLVMLEEEFAARSRARLLAEPSFAARDAEAVEGVPMARIEDRLARGHGVLPLELRSGRVAGLIQTDYEEDASLAPEILLENLAVKVTAGAALRSLLSSRTVDPVSIDYVIGSGEEAIGDRYQRGGGSLAKAVAEYAGCLQATGSDVKAFCCGPVHAMIVAAGLIASGVFSNVAVVGGCSLAKLGMKFRGHLDKGMPVMEDLLAGFALLMGPDDGESPRFLLDAIGRHSVAAGSAQQQIVEALVQAPLDRLGLRFTDVGKYATELHNPEITETAGSGDVPRTNYRLIAALAARHGDIAAGSEARDRFVADHGMPGFSPTQGHVASAIPYLAHALDALRAGDYRHAMFLAKGSFFLGRMTRLSDGASFLLEGRGP